MNSSKPELWQRFQKYYTEFPSIGLAIDFSRMNFADDYLASMKARMQKAFIAMAELEKGGIANPDEKRMVGHYWLRNPALAPTQTIRKEIEDTLAAHQGIRRRGPQRNDPRRAKARSRTCWSSASAVRRLGPQFVAHALGQPTTDKLSRPFLR